MISTHRSARGCALALRVAHKWPKFSNALVLLFKSARKP